MSQSIVEDLAIRLAEMITVATVMFSRVPDEAMTSGDYIHWRGAISRATEALERVRSLDDDKEEG